MGLHDGGDTKRQRLTDPRSKRQRSAVTLELLSAAVEKAYEAANLLTHGEIYSSQDVPGLSDVDPTPFIVSLTMIDGTSFTLASPPKSPHADAGAQAGNASPWFLTQSTFKPLVYAMALEKLGSVSVHRSVGSKGGLAYGAFEVLPDGRAPNPLINAGALTLLEKLSRSCTEEDIAKFCCTIGDSKLTEIRESLGIGTERWYDDVAVRATEADSIRNVGLCGFLASRCAAGDAEPLPKSEQAVSTAVRLYCMADCLKTNSEHLSRIAAIFANGGCTLDTKECLLSSQTVAMTMSQMLSAGMYEASGDWSREVGVAAKSGVSGAIMCVIPSVCGISIYSPKIDQEGNSVRGMGFVRELVKQLPELNMFCRA